MILFDIKNPVVVLESICDGTTSGVNEKYFSHAQSYMCVHFRLNEFVV